MARKSVLPRYFVWRGGRPCWNPGPGLRAKGHARIDLKDEAGRWLSMGAAIERAHAINTEVDAGLKAAPPAPPRTLADLFAAFKGTPEKPSERWQGLAPRTRDDYAQEMAILQGWAGDTPVAALRRADCRNLYGALKRARGTARAVAILRVLRLALNYAIRDLEWIVLNPAAELDLDELPGRTVMWQIAELAAFDGAASWIGRDSQGDAQILALCTAQSRANILAAAPLALESGVYRMMRRKTGRVAYIPPSPPLEDRLATMRGRNAAAFPNIAFATELVCTATGSSYPLDGDYFAGEHRAVRAVASGLAFVLAALGDLPKDLKQFVDPAQLHAALDGKVNLPFAPTPSLWPKRFQDYRDTAVTMLYAHTRDIGRVATVSGHSLKTAQEIIDKHYFVRNAGLALDAIASFDGLMKKEA